MMDSKLQEARRQLADDVTYNALDRVGYFILLWVISFAGFGIGLLIHWSAQ